MMKNKNKLIVLFLFLLIISACSSNDSSGPALVEISSDEEDLGSEKGQEENDDDEDDNEEEDNTDEETAKFIPPKLPNLPDPALSFSMWNQVNGPFGGTITSIFKSSDGYWVTTTDNSGLSDSCLLYTSPSPRDRG